MIKSVFALLAALFVGAVAGRTWLAPDTPGIAPTPGDPGGEAAAIAMQLSDEPGLDDESQLRVMVQALAGILNAEVEERHLMQQEFAALRLEVESLREALAQPQARRFGPGGRRQNQAGVDTEAALVRAGLDAGWAAEIRRRNDKLAMDTMFLQDQARREGWTGTERFANARNDISQQQINLRDEIGDEVYDGFLYETGAPNRVLINEVLQGSPANQAGMQPGDQILRYDGKRIFALNEMINESRSGSSGKLVPVEVMRDGREVQLYLPRGPMGVRTGVSLVNPAEGS